MKFFFRRLSMIFLFGCIALSVSAQVHVTFLVKQASVKHINDSVFLAGNFNNWVPSDKRYAIKTNNKGASRINAKFPPGNYKYKITRGGWDKVETTINGDDIDDRTFNLKKDTTIYITVPAWKDEFKSKPVVRRHTASWHVSVMDTAFEMPQLNSKRRIWIYLPDDYAASDMKFPVLYMHDGQNLFDEYTSGFGEWGVDEYLDSAFKKGAKECIVVGIDNDPVHRMNEYNPYFFAQFGKGDGNAYVDFLAKTLKPYIDAHYRTLRNKSNTFIAGSSMGGLISLYAVLKYPEVYGGAGIFSPAFWTASGIEKDVNGFSGKVNSKLFFYAGGNESDKMVPDMQRIEKDIKSNSKSAVVEVVDPPAQHNETAWRKHFSEFYQWMMNQQ